MNRPALALSGLSIMLLAACATVPGQPSPVGSSPATGPTITPAPTATTAPSGAAAPTATGSTTPEPHPTTSPAPPPGPDALSRGDAGPEVLALQERLSALGYWLGTPDSSFGSLTQQAVYALQGAAGLQRDGAVGPATRSALDAGTRPRARTDRGPVTEIDRDAGLVSFVRDGHVELVVHTSTGTFRSYRHDGRQLLADTPAGRFTVSWSFDGWRDGALGHLYRPRYFHPDGIAVHGYPSVPAYPASHGCARVSSEAMDMVWDRDLMPVGSEVRVF